MRIEIADDSFAHGTCSICPSFSGAARMLGASPGTIVVIYFVDFSDKMLSCQTQIQIFVTLKLNKFAKKCRVENEMVYISCSRFVMLINFRRNNL